MKSENLIVIIGNGFDIAHKMKTKYSDFANYYMNVIIEKIKQVADEPNFLNVEFLNSINKNELSILINEDYTIDNIIKLIGVKNYQRVLQIIQEKPFLIKKMISNQFLGKLYSNNFENWFDIEQAYFSELIELQSDIQYQKSLATLNREFSEIKEELALYLKTLKIKKEQSINEFIKLNIDKKYKRTSFINFNYTSTLKQYRENLNNTEYNINHIHGELESSIIFGYGNDRDKDYIDLRKIKDNNFFTHFKTFEYIRNKEYSNLFKQTLDYYSTYDVFVLGHSLGVTDKTLLEEILTSNKCNDVHLFKRSDLKQDETKVLEDFNNLVYSASRIFEDDSELRKKIINYKDSLFFP